MSDKTSFYYDPIRQGYDTNSWRTLEGAPALVAGGRLAMITGGTAGAAIHYADLLKGDISFNVNTGAPGNNTNHIFGVSSPNTSAYIRFNIGNVLTCETSDGITTTVSPVIVWDSSWSSISTVFRIRWEAERAVFSINGVQIYSVADASVPAGPLSLYLQDDSATPMTVGDMNVRGTQSFVMNPKTSDTSTFDGLVFLSQSVTISESVTIFFPVLLIPFMNNGTMFDSVTTSENIQISYSLPSPEFESVTITENIVLLKGGEDKPSVFDSVTVSENINITIS